MPNENKGTETTKTMDFLNQHKLWIGGAAATILLFSCACCGCGGIFVGLPALRERAKPKVAATFDAEDFMEKTKDNTAVMADHNGRTIEIVGAFGRLSSTIRNENFLSFKETGQRHHSPCTTISSPAFRSLAWPRFLMKQRGE